ncbi:hypothetical protein [Methanobacterium petrolearium]|uniref:hypothetical protein n=1 Tax=Methanobacterium petrolearium TaxID=710190 RepID=UPI001AE9B691|nr:hypothetical protein [Methanobacterium petrolearium]MBP1945701.1 nitrogen fixation/metabolism regulation signal transduction histidine kinase [Methanobacterium petrolearium]BDZ71947.1 hypothetical protein GCM10025861_24640 [Methanobacterium petrolearium]
MGNSTFRCIEVSKLGLNELRLIYDREEHRNSTIESKTAGLFGFSSLLVALLVFTLNSILSNIGTLPWLAQKIIQLSNIIGICLIFLCLISLLQILKIREFITPFAFDPNDIEALLAKSDEELTDFITEDYRKSVSHLNCVNEKKADLLEDALKKLKFGVYFSLIPLIGFLILKLWM